LEICHRKILTKTRTYKEAWQLYWNEASKEDKQKFLDLPNFDRWVFKDITGIDVEEQGDE